MKTHDLPLWETWSANYPLHVTAESEESDIPAGVTFDRAEKSVFATTEELVRALSTLGYTITPPKEGDPRRRPTDGQH